MRSIILIPVIHTEADLGSLAESVREHYVARRGAAGWDERQRLVAGIWDQIRAKVDKLRLDYRKVRVFQDGLPVCGQELRIVEQLAEAGSANHQLVLDLVHKGATLVGTEDPQLLIREYQMHVQELAQAGARRVAPHDAAELLSARDRFIAGRISETLLEDETGLLFLGAAHRLDTASLAGIEVRALE
jgi:hypothetical protein